MRFGRILILLGGLMAATGCFSPTLHVVGNGPADVYLVDNSKIVGVKGELAFARALDGAIRGPASGVAVCLGSTHTEGKGADATQTLDYPMTSTPTVFTLAIMTASHTYRYPVIWNRELTIRYPPPDAARTEGAPSNVSVIIHGTQPFESWAPTVDASGQPTYELIGSASAINNGSYVLQAKIDPSTGGAPTRLAIVQQDKAQLVPVDLSHDVTLDFPVRSLSFVPVEQLDGFVGSAKGK